MWLSLLWWYYFFLSFLFQDRPTHFSALSIVLPVLMGILLLSLCLLWDLVYYRDIIIHFICFVMLLVWHMYFFSFSFSFLPILSLPPSLLLFGVLFLFLKFRQYLCIHRMFFLFGVTHHWIGELYLLQLFAQESVGNGQGQNSGQHSLQFVLMLSVSSCVSTSGRTLLWTISVRYAIWLPVQCLHFYLSTVGKRR